MNAWLRQHRQALGSALSRFVRAAGLPSALVIGIALSLPTAGYLLLEGLRAVTPDVAFESQLSLFLKPEATAAEVDGVRSALKSDARISRTRFVPKETALQELEDVQGVKEVVGALGRNPLPDAFVIVARDAAAVDALVTDLAKLPAAGHVQADAAWARRLASLAAIGRLMLLILAAVLGLGLVAVTFNTIRLQIVTQREEIEVAKLIGATDAFIRRPFYYLGLLQGLAGGVVALAIVGVGFALLDREVQVLAQSYGSAFRFPFLGLNDAATVVGFAGLLGWLGAQLSVSRHLRTIDAG